MFVHFPVEVFALAAKRRKVRPKMARIVGDRVAGEARGIRKGQKVKVCTPWMLTVATTVVQDHFPLKYGK